MIKNDAFTSITEIFHKTLFKSKLNGHNELTFIKFNILTHVFEILEMKINFILSATNTTGFKQICVSLYF